MLALRQPTQGPRGAPSRAVAGRRAGVAALFFVLWAACGGRLPAAEAPAPPPESDAAKLETSEAQVRPLFTPEQKSFWAFQPPADPPLADVQNRDWAKSPLDRFVLAKLEAAGLAPAAPADKRTLIRRATFDLVGLPPAPEEIEAFLADGSPDAFARLVDRLLASPHYGERWGRHWLDVARYADSNGLDENLAFVNAYRYRDWVVGAFNRDQPYDEFIREQLAGDLLPPAGDPSIDYPRLIATGFLSLGAKMLAEDDPVKMEMDIIDEQLDTVGGAFLGLTLGCARCHDHKFDPLPAADYYSLAGIFKSTKTMQNFNVVATWHERPLASPQRVAEVQEHQRQLAEKRAAIDQRTKAAGEALAAEARRRAGAYLLAAAALERWRLALGPLLPGPEGQPPAGAVVLEAEKFDRGNVKIDFEAYGPGIGVIYNQGQLPNLAEYDVELPAAGAFQIELRYAAAEPRPVKLFVNGQLLKPDAASERTGSWQPDTQAWFAEAVSALEAGKQTIRLERDGPFPHFDKLALVPRPLPAGLDIRELAAPAEVARRRELNPAILDQWTKYLARTKTDPHAALWAWHAWEEASAQGSAPVVDEAGSPLAAAVFADPRPSSADELADRYQQLFEAAERARQELVQKADQLADPVLEGFRQVLDDPQGPFALPDKPEQYYPAEAKEELARLRDEVTALEQHAPPPLPQAMAVEDRQVTNLSIHVRGSHLALGAEVPRRFPRIIAGEDQPPLGDQRSGRLELAEWLARADHPLTSRVMVNRLWRWHFGEALVRTPDNFGRLGDRPANQPLLDWLARRFVEGGWSIKSLHRRIMLSATYQMSSAYDGRAALADPENRLCWRMNRRRLEAEAVRDAILAASGRLDRTMGGSLLAAKPREYVAGTTSVNNTNYESNRRSIYLPVVRSALYDVFQAFDFADPSVPSGSRATTTIAPQALFMMNSKLVSDSAGEMAAGLLGRADLDDAGRVRVAYRRAYGREPADGETARALGFVARYERALEAQEADGAQRRQRAWQALSRVILSSNEFLYVE